MIRGECTVGRVNVPTYPRLEAFRAQGRDDFIVLKSDSRKGMIVWVSEKHEGIRVVGEYSDTWSGACADRNVASGFIVYTGGLTLENDT